MWPGLPSAVSLCPARGAGVHRGVRVQGVPVSKPKCVRGQVDLVECACTVQCASACVYLVHYGLLLLTRDGVSD